MPQFDRDGVKLHYRDEGTGDPVLFIHGVGSTLDAWDPVLAQMPTGRHICLDLRGHGLSDRAPGSYDLQLMAGDVIALIHHLGLPKVSLVGFSLGGLIAQYIAIHHPELLSSVAILGAVAGRTAEEKARVEARLAQLEQEGPLSLLLGSVERWFTPEFLAANPEAIANRRAKALLNDPDCYMAAYRVLAGNDLAEDLHRISTPCLVMTGEKDVGSPPHMSELMQARIAGSRLVIIPGQKHSLLLEVPEIVASHLGALHRFVAGEI